MRTGHAAQNHPGVRVENEHKGGGRHRLLLVEDIEINRMLAETILEESCPFFYAHQGWV